MIKKILNKKEKEIFDYTIRPFTIYCVVVAIIIIIGSNIGAILSPMGALAGIMWLGYLKKHNVKYTFSTFIKNGIIISIPVMFIALIVLYVILI